MHIIENKVKCLKCKDTIESTHRHDFVTCSCGSTSVDGGKDYLRRLGNNYTIIFQNIITVEDVKNNPDKVYIFGDNLIKKGKTGQAIIRDFPNAFGIPTKRLPSMNTVAFFSDQPDEIQAVTKAINDIKILINLRVPIVYPTANVGSGLAKLPIKSPKIWSMVLDFRKYLESVNLPMYEELSVLTDKPVWTTADGVTKPIEELTDDHILNIIKDGYKNENIKNEAIKRGLIN